MCRGESKGRFSYEAAWVDLVDAQRDSGRRFRGIGEPICNSILHGHGRGSLLVRESPGLAGRGLWIVNQLCDLVELRSLPEGNVVRFRISA